MEVKDLIDIFLDCVEDSKDKDDKVNYKTLTSLINKKITKQLTLGGVVGQSEQLKNAEQEGYKRGWEEGAQYGYSAAHEGR
jgi:hypothetical protein